MLRGLYDKVIKLSESRHALPTLAAVSFAESSFFPIPPDVVLVPMALAQPHKARLYALVCTIASLLGGILGYAVGAFPYKIVTIASGFAGYDFFMFVVLSTITRGARFFLEAELLRIYGEPIRGFIEKRLTLVTTGFLAAIVGGFFIAKYAF